MVDPRHEQNRRSWNEATRAHNSHKRDQARFLREGGEVLFPEELELLGELAGKSLVHLQCNSGQDSLELARRGARVTGVDISDEAVAFAKQLSADSGIEASFERSDLFEWFGESSRKGRRFDVAFCSYGALCWLSDIRRWAKGVASVLEPSGRLVLVEFHPASMAFDEQMRLAYDYAGGRQLDWDDGVSDYVAQSGAALTPSGYDAGAVGFQNQHVSHEFGWSVADVVQAVLDAGLRLETLREYPYSNGARLFDGMIEAPGRRFRFAEGALPLMFGLSARR